MNTRTHTPPITPRLGDPDSERVRREHEQKIVELQSTHGARMGVLADVSLANATSTTVAHKLGRAPMMIIPSPPRGATSTGRIDEIRDGTQDRSKVIVLKATGWGATITVDVTVF